MPTLVCSAECDWSVLDLLLQPTVLPLGYSFTVYCAAE
jgi:hypothetical protein